MAFAHRGTGVDRARRQRVRFNGEYDLRGGAESGELGASGSESTSGDGGGRVVIVP